MRLQDIDKNFSLGERVCADGITRYNIPNDKFALYGVYYDEKDGRFMRVDKDFAATVNEGVEALCMHTAGGRLRFATDSKKFELAVEIDGFWIMSHMAIEGSAGFMLLEETDDGKSQFVKMLAPSSDQQMGFTLTADLKGDKMRNYVLWFPLYNGGSMTKLTIGLDENAKVATGKKYKDIKPILYYGSSITQGGCASRPDNCYQGFICKWNNVDFINLGFSGSAKGEDTMVDYLTGLDCSLFVCDYDHNAPTKEYLEETHYRLYQRYRAVRKDTPILFISAPRKGGDQWNERARIVRATYEKAKSLEDQNVYFLDGRTLFGNSNWEECTVDHLHPNDLGFYRMAKKIYKKMIEIDQKFE